MFLVELVMQGVRRFKDLSRLRFQSGFNFVSAGSEAGKTTAVDTMLRLLFPNSDPGSFGSLISRQTPDASRGALVVYSDDGAYYRVIQDFAKQGVNLSKYNASTKQFVLQQKDWVGAAQFMADMTGGMAETEFARLFLFRREHYRSGAQQPVPAAPSFRTAAAAPVRPVAAPAGRRSTAQEARLTQLRELLRKAEEAADADYRAQSAKMKLQEIGKKLETLDEVEGRYGDIEARLSELKGCESCPEDLPQLIEEHERNQVQRMSNVDQIQQDLVGLEAQRDGIPQPSIVKNKLFILGILVGAATVVAALFFLTTEQAAYFPMGILASLGLVGGAWYNSLRKNAQRKVIEKEIDELLARLEEVEQSFGQGGNQIATCMEAAGVASPAELKDVFENYRYFRSMLDDVAEQRDRMLGEASRDALIGEYERQQLEVLELEKAAQALAKDNVDTYSIRQDIERLEQEMGSSASTGATWDFSTGTEETGADVGIFSAPAASGGFFTELEIAGRVGGIDPDILLPAVAAAVQRNLSAVTGGAYVRADIAAGSDPVVYDKDHGQHRVADLSHTTADAVYFCLRAGLVEAMAGKLRLPFIMDDALAGFDPIRQKAACQVLRALGAKTQVILFASNPALRAQGDAALELK